MEKIYIVNFNRTGESYQFDTKEEAIDFIKNFYGDSFVVTDNGLYTADLSSLEQTGYIDDYAWIEERHFEDENE